MIFNCMIPRTPSLPSSMEEAASWCETVLLSMVFIDEKMDSSMYRLILEQKLIPRARKFYGQHKWIFQQDNDSKQVAKLTKGWFRNDKISVLSWPSQLPDLNPIENFWKMFKTAVHKRSSKSLADLKLICMKEWNKIPQMYCQKLVSHYNNCFCAVIVNKGHATEYKILCLVLFNGFATK